MRTIYLKEVKLEVPASEHSYSIKKFLLGSKASLAYTTILDIPFFEANEGDRICVIGRNGQGKTTFMKTVAGIYLPTSGKLETSHKPTAALAAGIGLEDDLSIDRNIKLSLTLRNTPPKKMKAIIEHILNFCELENTPHKLYKHLSTGFKSRLSFAIAISEDPNILILDEVLGGGDEFFMKKATIKLRECINSSRTALIATHSPDELRGICNRLLIIENGQIFYDGDFEDGIKIYRSKYAS